MRYSRDSAICIGNGLVHGFVDVEPFHALALDVEALQPFCGDIRQTLAADVPLIVSVRWESSGSQMCAQFALTGRTFCFTVHLPTTIRSSSPYAASRSSFMKSS